MDEIVLLTSLAIFLLLAGVCSIVFNKIKLPPRGKGCAVCSDTPTITELTDYEQPACELKQGNGA